MEYKVSYRTEFDKDGTCYRQRVRVSMTTADFLKLNEEVGRSKEADKNRYFFLQPLECGRNFTTISTADFVRDFIGAENDPRYKSDRNSVIYITLTDTEVGQGIGPMWITP